MRLLIIFIFVLTLFSCTKKDKREIQLPSTKQEAMEVYKDALKSLKENQYFIAKKKFDQSENLLPQTAWAARSALMSGFCLYSMKQYDEALEKFNRCLSLSEDIGYYLGTCESLENLSNLFSKIGEVVDLGVEKN